MLRHAARLTFSRFSEWQGQFRAGVSRTSVGGLRYHSSSSNDTSVSGNNGSRMSPPDSSTHTRENSVETILGMQLARTDGNAALIKALSLQNGSADEHRRVRKRDLIERFRQSESDTGSPEVQIALMTDKINTLTTHMINHKQDKMKKRSMAKAVGQRRRMMKYLLRISPERYMKLAKELGLRPNSVYGTKRVLGALKKPRPTLSFTDM